MSADRAPSEVHCGSGSRSEGGAVALSPQCARRLVEHARRAYPRECCGILLGLTGERTVVCEAQPAPNLRGGEAADRYEIDPGEIVRADREAEDRGWEIVGFYHSHPDHPAAPSPVDLEHAWSGYLYLIVSARRGGGADIRAWVFDSQHSRFHERPIEARAERDETCRDLCAGGETTRWRST